jgi:hypothetical protein
MASLGTLHVTSKLHALAFQPSLQSMVTLNSMESAELFETSIFGIEDAIEDFGCLTMLRT